MTYQVPELNLVGAAQHLVLGDIVTFCVGPVSEASCADNDFLPTSDPVELW